MEKTIKSNNEASCEQLIDCYKQKMLNFIYATPHIPPTLFELKQRHFGVKNDLMQMCDATFSDEFVRQIDQQFTSMAMRTIKEHQMCQTAFVIGW